MNASPAPLESTADTDGAGDVLRRSPASAISARALAQGDDHRARPTPSNSQAAAAAS